MTPISKNRMSRRRFLTGLTAITASSFTYNRSAIASKAPIKIGILLPYSGTYAMLGNSITDGFKLRINLAGNKMGGRPIEYTIIDSEMSVPKAPQNTNKLIKREKVDFVPAVRAMLGIAPR